MGAIAGGRQSVWKAAASRTALSAGLRPTAPQAQHPLPRWRDEARTGRPPTGACRRREEKDAANMGTCLLVSCPSRARGTHCVWLRRGAQLGRAVLGRCRQTVKSSRRVAKIRGIIKFKILRNPEVHGIELPAAPPEKKRASADTVRSVCPSPPSSAPQERVGGHGRSSPLTPSGPAGRRHRQGTGGAGSGNKVTASLLAGGRPAGELPLRKPGLGPGPLPPSARGPVRALPPGPQAPGW